MASRSVGRAPFSASVPGGEISGWVAGTGPPVLLLHGGPGLSCEYMDPVAAELAPAFQVATFQQRGLSPSTIQGPFTIAQALSDIESVLDHLGWDVAYLLGHSWGGHLAFHAAVSLGDRFLGVLSVDPLGAVGDGGLDTFVSELRARLSPDRRERVGELDALTAQGPDANVDADALAEESMQLLWPSYFAVPSTAPPAPSLRTSAEAGAGLLIDVFGAFPALEAALPSIAVPVGVVVGAESPMPSDEAGLATAARVPGAWSVSVPAAGHFVWLEQPGSVLAAMTRLVPGQGG